SQSLHRHHLRKRPRLQPAPARAQRTTTATQVAFAFTGLLKLRIRQRRRERQRSVETAAIRSASTGVGRVHSMVVSQSGCEFEQVGICPRVFQVPGVTIRRKIKKRQWSRLFSHLKTRTVSNSTNEN